MKIIDEKTQEFTLTEWHHNQVYANERVLKIRIIFFNFYELFV